MIRRGDKEFTPSKYQEDILKFAKNGVGNGFINACAGSSKTTMLENILYHIPSEKNKVFIAFNKSIVDEMTERIGNSINNINITTYHSLGYSILMENFRGKEFNVSDEKYINYLRQNILSLTQYGEVKSLGKLYNSYFNNIVHLIDYARYYHASNIPSIKNISEKYGLNIIRDECIVCKRVLDWGRENIDTIDFTDMVWLVNELNLVTKKHKYDVLLIDEAQDTSIMQQQMTERCKKRGSRTFVVGDEHQSINVWAGSDMDAVEKYKGDNVKIFELPISYRCPKKIVEFAKKYSPNIQYADNAIDGEIRYDVPITMPSGSDMVLCRNTAPLIELYQKYLRYNKKCYIKGSNDVMKTLLGLINSTNSEKVDINCLTFNGMIPRLYQTLFSNINKLVAVGYTEEDAIRHKSTFDLYDNINAIKVLCDNIETTEELITKITDIFKDRSDEGIVLSTIHKAKGLEADNVYILCPSLLPNSFARREWEIKSEEHLMYVAYTRSKKSLNFMHEDENRFRVGASFNFTKMLKELNNIKEKIAFNNEHHIDESNITINSISAHTLGDPIFYETKKNGKIKGGIKYNSLF